MAKVTIQKLQQMKAKGEKITMITAYDYPTAVMVNKAGLEIILVGDSLMMTVMGETSTVGCTVDYIIHHTKAVINGAPDPMIVSDMPFGSYNVSKEQAIENANRLMIEGHCDVIKLEGGTEVEEIIRGIVDSGTPVMGHIGLTPQTASKMGGFKVQGKGEAAKKVLEDALAVERAGAFAVVLEGIPEALGKIITEKLAIPTIGIGGGRYTDGQVIVFHDMMGMFDKFVPKFVKQYAKMEGEIVKHLEEYKTEVKEGKFPSDAYVFGGVSEEELKRLY